VQSPAIFALANDKFRLLRSQVIQENVTMKSTLKDAVLVVTNT